MGETAKDAGSLALTGLAFGNPLTTSNAMAPLITGSQAYWIGHGINDGAPRPLGLGFSVKFNYFLGLTFPPSCQKCSK